MKPAPGGAADLAFQHGLSEAEYQRILSLLGREPTYEELGIFAVMWSEHCSYKSSKHLLRLLPSRGKEILQGPGENAGVIDAGDGFALVFKMESHNHPSYIEPYHGAATGVGGILRDIFTMGARPVATLNSLCFGSLDHPKTAYLVRGVVAGIGGYGNCVGVPTVGGEVYFDAGYDHNILVNVFTLGVARSDKIFRARAAGVGNPVIYIGARTGRDGIHGASLLASAEFGPGAEEKRPSVQVGDPLMGKLLLEACLELMEGDAVIAIQDMGAAGLTSSAAEMASRGNVGIGLDVTAVPLREEGMTPYEILLSESQERMLMVVRSGQEERVRQLCAKWDLEMALIGRVTDDEILRVVWKGEEVVRIPVASLSREAPVYDRPAAEPKGVEEIQHLDLRHVSEPDDYNQVLLRLLSSPNLASRAWIYRQYDYLVRGNTIVCPGSDAAILRIKGSTKGIALSVDGNSRYCLLDPYVGAVIAVAEGARNVASAGARPLAISDCLNFGNPEKPEIMWQFQQTIYGLRDACLALDLAVVSGNVSFYNETEGLAIPPTPTIATVGLLEDARCHVTQWFKEPGDVVILLGITREELGGSEYLALVHGQVRGTPPWIEIEAEKHLQRFCQTAAAEGLLRSAHDVAEGGLAVSIAECCISGPRDVGVRIELSGGIRPDAMLFAESQSRVIVSARHRHVQRVQDLAAREGVPFSVVGEVGGSDLDIGNFIHLPIDKVHRAWETPLEKHGQKG